MAKKYYNGKKKSGNMMGNQPSEYANMPQEMMHKMYPSVEYLTATFDDTIKGIDEQMRADVKNDSLRRTAGTKRF